MGTSRKYFQDRTILLLLSINAFLSVLTSIWIILSLDTSRGAGYIVEFRPNLGINAFKTGSANELLSFAAFALIITATNIVLSYKAYHIRKHFSIAILAMTTLLLVLTIYISKSLLIL